MLVLDTAALPAEDRAEAFQASVSHNCTTSLASFEDPDTLHAEMHVYDLGSTKVFNIDATGTTLTRTPRMSRAMNECPIALALPMRTTNHLVRARDQSAFDADDLILVDLSAPYVYGWSGTGASYAFHVEYDDLGLPMDTIARATDHLRRSPLYALVRNHVRDVMVQAGHLEGSVAGERVGAATAQLMRALIATAADDSGTPATDMLHDSLTARVHAYVRQNIRDRDLTPTRVAHANGISVRTLHKLYEPTGVSFEQTVIAQRLRGARGTLASTSHRDDSIAVVARAWGFSSPSFFTSKFRQTYGETPRAFRRQAPTATALRADQQD